ncbi:hypothetical protein [Nonomuraea sp. NPDC049400]|uniref:hypothetical protein n=1 Tax=Nonomuraea sp. NPDC049400 TaxID=3364352 RepID=UPI0037AE0586
MTVDWISWLRSDVWFHPRVPADTTEVDLLHPVEATHALQVMEHHAGLAARALCSHAMRTPAPDGAGYLVAAHVHRTPPHPGEPP